ncbi:hypothetical protein CQA53_06460 [Helicobacter didelphidarum]|uniref:Uncharacterized protein n=1 Tax=Helicobacter didelphidarum TaxID=2040648 RepID=A0A3D8IK71_9HELI|nr:hypothetical protein [Helicobacter didelphidarum]RDU65315.1 hypothetical protein CQA53_06460 [Helicobacter didelphidarum]
MDFIKDLFYFGIELIDIDTIQILLQKHLFAYIIVMALFCCVVLLISVFSRYKILSLRIFIAWIFSSVISLLYLLKADDVGIEVLRTNINSQIILSFASSILLLIFWIFSSMSTKPKKRKKNFGYHTWWISIVGFVVLLAFCCFLNVSLFVATAPFYMKDM